MNERAFPVVAITIGLLLGATAVVGAKTKVGELSKECIGSEARKNLSECPSGPSKFAGKKKRGTAFSSAPPPRTKKAVSDYKPEDPTQEMEGAAVRDARQFRLKNRAQALLIREISGLERLFKSTPKNDPDRAQLIRRLAEG